MNSFSTVTEMRPVWADFEFSMSPFHYVTFKNAFTVLIRERVDSTILANGKMSLNQNKIHATL
jgi:hypothetical protein